ncbi:MAG: hypothetical protein H6629_13170 [Calditrichae bacterium]|nr:hypothetical protein [Calditrichia bacterium]
MNKKAEISPKKMQLRAIGLIVGLIAAFSVVFAAAASMRETARLVDIVALCGGSFAAGVAFVQTVQFFKNKPNI